MSDDLPMGWVETELEKIFEFNPRHSSSIDKSIDVSFVPMPSVCEHNGIILPHNTKKLEEVWKGYTHFQNNDVIFAKITPCMENGKIALASNLHNDIACGSTEFHVLRSLGAVLPLYVWYFLRQRSFLRDAEQRMTGAVGQRRVPVNFLKETNLAIPPINEQRRIVDKLDRIGDRNRTARNELNHIPKLIARYKQAVLAAAFRGDLTADWREKNINLKSASELLEKVREEQIKHLSPKNKISTTNGYFDNSVETDFLPDSWRFCQIGDIGIVCNGSTPSRKMPEYWNGNINWVSSGEVRNNIITTTKEGITQEGFDNSSVRMLPSGTILLAMIGEGKTRGQTAILKTKATINQNIAAVIIDHGLVSSEYLWYWFQSQYQTTREAGNGSGPQALNCQRVRELSFIFCPLEEQKEIVRRVEKMFEKIDMMEQEYQKAAKLCDRLEQATLAKAFRGELLPQDPDDEPASVLLEQVKREKQVQPKGKSVKSK